MRGEPEIRQLRALVAVVEQGGFTRAATSLGLSQSTISEAIAGLERSLGTAVLLKGRRRPTLTPAGEALLPHARQVLAALDAATGAVAAAEATARATVAVGTSESISAFVLPAVLAELRRARPGTRYTVTTAACTAIRADVQAGRLDLGLVLEPAETGADDETTRPLAAGRILLFARPEHPLARRVADAGDVALLPLFLSDAAGSFHGVVQRWLQADGFPADRLYSTGSVEGVKRGVLADPDALGLLPAHAVGDELARGDVVEVRLRRALPAVWLKAVWRRDAELAPPAAALVERLATVELSGKTGRAGATVSR